MIGKQFGQEYIELREQEENLSFCIDILLGIDENEKTKKAIEAIKEAQGKIQLRISEMDSYEVVKRIS